MGSNFFLKSFRILLLPFALVYWLIIGIRNWLFDKKIIKSSSFGLPLICIGNLSVGGTGKSPMVEYLIEKLNSEFKVATLSRGYKRKTKGYTIADTNTTALEIGDEPMQFHLKFPGIPVAVGERRIEAIPFLLHDRPGTQVIILDDAFQHRNITAGLNILLTECNNLFTRDFFLPTGDLRDLKKSYKRAQIIIITKCPIDLPEQERARIKQEIKPLSNQAVYFTALQYDRPYHISREHSIDLSPQTEVLLVTGIANPKPLKHYIEQRSRAYHLAQYPDHHIFSIDDLRDIKKKFMAIEAENRILLTTEKDAVRLVKFRQEIADLPLYVIPVRHYFLFGEEDKFVSSIKGFIRSFKSEPAMAETNKHIS